MSRGGVLNVGRWFARDDAFGVPITQIDKAPQHFTNLQLGLMTARKILARRGGVNKQVFIITDGQPTAHVQGEYVYLLYPPEEVTTMATLCEASLSY